MHIYMNTHTQVGCTALGHLAISSREAALHLVRAGAETAVRAAMIRYSDWQELHTEGFRTLRALQNAVEHQWLCIQCLIQTGMHLSSNYHSMCSMPQTGMRRWVEQQWFCIQWLGLAGAAYWEIQDVKSAAECSWAAMIGIKLARAWVWACLVCRQIRWQVFLWLDEWP
jgi:hypothetical protein